jgi:hypothetical protein
MTSRASFSGMIEGALNLLTDSFLRFPVLYISQLRRTVPPAVIKGHHPLNANFKSFSIFWWPK